MRTATGTGRLLLRRSGIGGGRWPTSPPLVVADGSRSTNNIIARRHSSTSTSSSNNSAARAAADAAAAVPGAIWLPLPRLAPHMTTGRVQAWLKGEGEAVACYEVCDMLVYVGVVDDSFAIDRAGIKSTYTKINR